MPEDIKTKIAENIRKAVAEMEQPKSVHAVRPSQCKRHRYLVTDRCDFCGTPMEVNAE